jgi:hypothetical protein
MYEHYISVTLFEGTKGEKVIYKKNVYPKGLAPGAIPSQKQHNS